MQFSDLVYMDAAGFHVADYPTILAYFTTQYQNIYGTDVQLSPDTEDGEWIAVQAQAAFDASMAAQSAANGLSPVTAQGTALSRGVKINGLARIVATNSTVDLDIGGSVGTPITNGIAVDILNQQWNLPPSVTIPSSGSITVTATAQNVGAIAASANTVTGIFTPTNGWQTVNNAAAATIGQPVEQDATLRARQVISVANPSSTLLEGTEGAVANVLGVVASQGYENDTDTTDGNGIPSHSISIVVAGGDSMAIAQAIQIHKGPGCGTYGTTSETVFDSHGMPSTINFFRPTQKSIDIAITLVPGIGFSSGFETLIAQSLADYINALGIGTDVLISKLFTPAYLPNDAAASATFDITSLEICFHGGSPAGSNLTIAFNEESFLDITNVSITT